MTSSSTFFRVITLEYGEPLPAGMGAYDHPAGDGATAALGVRDVVEFKDENEALEFGIESEKDPLVHSAVIEEFDDV